MESDWFNGRLFIKIALLVGILQGVLAGSQGLLNLGDDVAPGTIRAYTVSDDGRKAVVVDYDGNLLELDLKSGRVDTVAHYQYAVQDIAVSPKLSHVAFAYSEKINWFSLSDPKHLIQTFEVGRNVSISGLSFSQTGRYLAARAYHLSSVPVWNLENRGKIALLTPCHSGQEFTGFSPDEQMVAAVCDDNIVRIWDLGTSRLVRDLSVGPFDFVNWFRFSDDGRRLIAATGRKNLILVFDRSTGEIITTLKGHTDQVDNFGVQPNGGLVTASEDETVRVWDIKTGKILKTLRIPNARISANGLVALAQTDQPGVLELWDISTGRRVSTFDVQSDSATAYYQKHPGPK
jgi:WD40 repeat protein